MNKISNRLLSLSKYISKHDKIIDIGCDHALLDIYLVKNKIVKNIIVSDISYKALEQGKKNIEKYKLTKEIETKIGNGLEVLKEEDNVDTIIISGLGTSTILDILNNNYLNKINKLIIQSNNDHYKLRKNIVSLGYKIDNEEALEDKNKNYINIVFTKGNKLYSENELKFGTKKMLNKNYYYEQLIKKQKNILHNITDENKIKEIKKDIKYLEESKI